MQGPIESKFELTDIVPNINETNLALPVQQRGEDSSPKECRICFDSHQSSVNPLVSPCDCAGSLRWVHQNCLREWLQAKVGQNVEEYNGSQDVKCEVCKREIEAQVRVERECEGRGKIAGKIKGSPILFFTCIVGIVLALAVLIYSVIQLVNQVKTGYNQFDAVSRGVVIVSIPVELLLFIYFLVNLVRFFVVKRAHLKFQDRN